MQKLCKEIFLSLIHMKISGKYQKIPTLDASPFRYGFELIFIEEFAPIFEPPQTI
jgi:hypothetical protein